MSTPLEESSENNSVTTLEWLPNEIQLMILKHLPLYDLYNIFSDMNSRYNSLLYYVTPKAPNIRALHDDIRTFERHLQWCHEKFIWWEERIYYLIPQRGSYALRWKFVPQSSVEQLKDMSENYRRILPVISKYPLHINTLFLIFDVCDIKKLCFLGKRFLLWMNENYIVQHEIIIDSDSSWCTKEVCNAFSEINQLERERQERMIYEQAKKIWSELSELEEFLIPYLPAFPQQGGN